ncbi:MAG: ABC transporter permease [Acidobacteriota bacterium]|nr:ABC transporter permease [Acidobacteriota bacterium]
MTSSEAFRRALESLGVHKLRSALTMLGMIFGVGAVIAMLSIGAGAERQALAMIERLGLSNVLVRSKDFRPDELAEVRKKSQGLSPRDMAALEEAVPGVLFAAPRVRVTPWRVRGDGVNGEAQVFGVSWRHAELTHLAVAEGRFLDALDERTHGQVCVVGADVARRLFGLSGAIGRDVKVNDLWLTVVGVLAPESSGGLALPGPAGGATGEIYVPWTTALRKLDKDPLDAPLAEIILALKPGASAREQAALVPPLLDRLHGGASDFELVVPERLLAQSQRTQRLFNVVMGAIAGISLLVGGIGIMNIMLATVLERTREIGVRRAVGARRADIRFQFVAEAFALSFTGGLAGIVMGLVISRVVAVAAGWPTVVTWWSLLLSTGVSAVVGLASGIYPALRAAALHPIDALRYE